MSPDALDRSMSSLSLNSVESQSEDDWDSSLLLDGGSTSVAFPIEVPVADAGISAAASHLSRTTPRNSIVFPGGTPGRATHYNSNHRVHSRNGSVEGLDVGNKKRTLSDLFKLHSEKGSNGEFSVEEAKRIADLLGQWINASSSPYEGEDDFFVRHTQDDITLNTSGSFRRVTGVPVDPAGRPRGKSESLNSSTNVGSRPPSVLDVTHT